MAVLAARRFPALSRRPPGPPLLKGQNVPPNYPLPEERARAIAMKVARLFSRHPDYFRSNAETFKQEDAERQRQEKGAGRAVGEAFQAIVDEQEAVKAGKMAPRLTNEGEQPGPGYEWRHGRRVEGWIPPEAVRAMELPEKAGHDKLYWPGRNPTPATMATLLAALHDECLPNSPAILDPASADWGSVATRSTDYGYGHCGERAFGASAR